MNDEVFYEIALKKISKTASFKEEELLKDYLLDEAYKEKYDILLQTLGNPSFANHEFSLERGLKRLRHNIKQSERRQTFKFKKALTVAAAVVVFLGLGVFFKDSFFTPQLHYLSVTSPIGERTKVWLPDSSLVFLNSGATVNYPEQFTGRKRDVRLTGEAFFQVKRNVKKPFIVQSGHFTTTVLGTSFNVINHADTSFQVTVKTGKVKVENTVTKKQFFLEKDTQVVFNPLEGDLVKGDVDARTYTDWHKNILRFDAISAKEAFAKMEQWYNVKMICESDTILNRKIRAAYKNEPIDKVLKSLEFMIGIQYTVQNDSILIK